MRTAFKEWAVVVDALGRGQQILVLRKGGIREGKGGFKVEQPEFLLFPTMYHQQRESVIPSAQRHFDEIAPSLLASDPVRFDFFAKVESWYRLASLDDVSRLRGQHIWRDEIIAERFHWGAEEGIFVLALRVFRLHTPMQLPMTPSYAGCKSWIELESDIPTSDAVPVLDDIAFADKMREFHNGCAR